MTEFSKITSFSGEYRFLSNFWPCEVVGPSNLVSPSVEHAYVAYKTNDIEFHRRVLSLTAGQAKRAGRNIEIRSDWNAVKFAIMSNLLEQKFKNPQLEQMLLDTGDSELIEGNSWGDVYWGQYPLGMGENNLGNLLMRIRNRKRGLLG